MNDRNNWHLMSADEVAKALDTDRYKGLRAKTAERKRRIFGENSVWRVRRAGAADIARATVFDLATLLLVISAAAAAMFDMRGTAVAMIILLAVGGVLRMTAYIRASRILEGMAEEKIPVCSVIRDGKALVVHAYELLPGDVVFVEAGDTVPCDGRVISAADSIVDESGITDNNAPVHKFDTVIKTESEGAEVPVEYRSNTVFAGSLVKSGRIRMIATATGEDTLIVRKQGGVEIEPSSELPTVEKLSKQSRVVSLVMLAFVMLITVLSLFVGDEFTLPEVFLGTMAMAVAAMSEFLTAIGYIIVSVTVHSAASGGVGAENAGWLKTRLFAEKKHPKIVMRSPGAIDSIAAPDRMVFMGTSFFKSGGTELFAHRVNGRLYLKNKKGASPSELLALAFAAVSGSRVGLAAESDATGASDSREYKLISRAIDAYTRTSGKGIADYSPLSHVSSSDPLSAGMNISLVERDGAYIAVACGPIDAVLRNCKSQRCENGDIPLDSAAVRGIYTECARLEFSGAKVVAVCEKPSEYNTLSRLSAITCEMTFVGFFAVAEESEPGAAENITFMREHGIMPILFTQSPKEDLYYCHRIGMFNKNTRVIPYAELRDGFDKGAKDGVIVSFEGIPENALGSAYSSAMDKLSPGAVTAVAAKKKQFAKAFAKADIGFAVSRYFLRPIPEQLSKNAAVAIYPTKSKSGHEFGGLAGIIHAIRLARRAKRNTESARYYLTASQVARLTVILLSVVFALQMPSPVFILIWGLIFDFLAVLTAAFDGDDGKTDKMPRSNACAVIFGVLIGVLSSVAVPLVNTVAEALNISLSDGITPIISASLILCGLVLSYHSIKRGSLFGIREVNVSYLAFACASVLFALITLFTGGGAALSGGSLCPELAAFALIPALVLLLIFEITKLVCAKTVKKHTGE